MLLCLLMPSVCAFAQQWDQPYVESLFKDRALSPIEGVWQFPADGATIAIVASSASTFDIFLLDSPRLDVRPGTPVGEAVATPSDNCFDGVLESKKFGKDGKLNSPSVTFTVNSNGALVIKPYKTGYSVSFKRWFYRMFGLSLVENNRRPAGLDGARRLFPYMVSDHYPVRL